MSADRFRRPDQNEVLLWKWSLDLKRAQVERLECLLSPDERETADRFATPKLRTRYVAGRGGLRLILGRVVNRDPGVIRFAYQYAGKPVFDEALGVEFNLSHSSGMALLAVASTPVGVDLERHRLVQSRDDLVRRWFSPGEADRFGALAEEERTERFFHLWTLKEAIVKLLGGSVGDVLREIEPPTESDSGRTLLAFDNPLGARHCVATRVGIGPEWFAAVATVDPPSVCGPSQPLGLSALLEQ